MGFEAEAVSLADEQRSGSSRTQGAKLEVFLPASGDAKMRPAGSKEWREIPRARGEPTNHVALRIAELARAFLLEEGGVDAPPTTSPPQPRRMSTTFSQRLLVNGYGSQAGALGQDVSWWFGRFGLGPVATFMVTTQAWEADPKHFSLRFASLGLGFKYSLAPSAQELFEAQLVGSLSATGVHLRETGGKDEDRFRAYAGGTQAGGGVDVSFRLTRHVRLGGLALGEAVMLFGWPKDDGNLGGKEAELLVQASERFKARYQITLAAALTGHW